MTKRWDNDIEEILDAVLEKEGSVYVDDKVDLGGATKYGITFRTYRRVMGRLATKAMLKNMTAATAKEIYYDLYIRDAALQNLSNQCLRHLAIDYGVHSGPARALENLRKQVKLPSGDGKRLSKRADRLSEDEWEFINAATNPLTIAQGYLQQRASFLFTLCQRQPGYSKYANGFRNRLNWLADKHGLLHPVWSA